MPHYAGIWGFAGTWSAEPGLWVIGAMARALSGFLRSYLLVAVPLLYLAASRVARAGGLPLWPVWGLAAATVVSVLIQGKFFRYQWVVAFPFLALLGGFGAVTLFADLQEWAASPRRRELLYALILGALLFLAPETPGALYNMSGFVRWLAGKDTYAEHLARYPASANVVLGKRIKATTRPDETILVWGFEPVIYFVAERSAPTRFYLNFFVTTAWDNAPWRAELMEDLRRNPPAVIAVRRRDILPFQRGHLLDSAALLEEFPDLRAFVETRYDEAEEIGTLVLYRRRE
jgi:hypothetical protein